MREVFVLEDNIISPLGLTTEENIASLKAGKTGVSQIEDIAISDIPFFASLFSPSSNYFDKKQINVHSRFEQLLINSISTAIKESSVDPKDPKTILIISSTKGNIELIEKHQLNESLAQEVSLATSANKIATHFNFHNNPIVVSTACISGVSALLTAMRLIQSSIYDNAVVVGGDLITKFVLSGFQSFQAVSDKICKPFDAKRNGINLGEGAATIILSCHPSQSNFNIKVSGGCTSNDANHISGPSRTGEELNYAIQQTLNQSNLKAIDIDYISAHGTATLYNDEMEAKAIHLSKLAHVPINSLKGYFGHTLGGAGLIESVTTIHSMKDGFILPTYGHEELGVSETINICKTFENKKLNNCIKTISGFGGCNGALLFSRN